MNFKGLAQLQQAYGLGMLQHHTRRCCFSLLLAEYTVNTAVGTHGLVEVTGQVRNLLIRLRKKQQLMVEKYVHAFD